jgi:biofilm PGA synthesis N-glycosyltransferase PgaC
VRDTIGEFLLDVEQWPGYQAGVLFVAGYPLLAAVVWIVTALWFFGRRERHSNVDEYDDDAQADLPLATVLVPAYNEEVHILETVHACLAIDYADYEVLVVDDGSTDATRRLLEPLAAAGRIRLLAKEVNEGKAMALNDGLVIARGEVCVIVDADARPDPKVLRAMVPHFRSARVAAVTGNPRVVERHSMLTRLQTVEFTAIVSLLRRAQRVWGRLLTVSGVVTAVRVSAVFDVGGFSHDMETEDIDLTWKLQRRFYDVRYEPRAIVWMRVPTTLPGLWRQRSRWARGLAQVLRRHALPVAASYRARRMWPTLIEAVCSVLWAYTFVVLATLWMVALFFGVHMAAVSPFPAMWGMVVATMAIVQLSVGSLLDSRYERSILASLGYVVFYPLIYWTLMAIVTVVNTPRALLRPAQIARWHTVRGT